MNGGFGIYIHWPFCESKCPYCDFNSHVAKTIDQTRWMAAYLSELDRLAQDTGDFILNSVFFGGGTPSLMEPRLVGAILDRIGRNWRMSNDIEITLEANPGSSEAQRFLGYRAAGVNRISIGVQALNDADLRRLGRKHSAAEALAAINLGQSLFNRASLDLIYARQHQTLQDWEQELKTALTLGTEHISLYQLTIEDGTVFSDRYQAGHLKGLPNEDIGADMYQRTLEICAEHGLSDYEVSNLAKPGAESRHNLIYWRMGSYIGIGPGAHGRLAISGQRIATESIRQPGAWISSVEAGKGGYSETSTLTASDQLSERLLMGLRLKEGIPLNDLNALGFSLDHQARISDLIQIGMLEPDPQTLRATAQGRLLLNSVISKIV